MVAGSMLLNAKPTGSNSTTMEIPYTDTLIPAQVMGWAFPSAAGSVIITVAALRYRLSDGSYCSAPAFFLVRLSVPVISDGSLKDITHTTAVIVVTKRAYKNIISKYLTPYMEQYINKRILILICIIIVLGIIVALSK
jgi:hypothetical protein